MLLSLGIFHHHFSLASNLRLSQHWCRARKKIKKALFVRMKFGFDGLKQFKTQLFEVNKESRHLIDRASPPAVGVLDEILHNRSFKSLIIH